MIQDTNEVTILRLELEPGLVEWVGFNPTARTVSIDSRETRDPFFYSRGSGPD